MLAERTLSVNAIRNGTVIDHITANRAISILRLLQHATSHTKITIGINLPSKTSGFKDMIKFEERHLTEGELIKIALIAPHATVNIISNYELANKFKVSPPKSIRGIFKCPNHTCITNHEPMSTYFHIDYFREETKLHCHYCRKQHKFPEIENYLLESVAASSHRNS